jgi:hypothetical protein
MIFSLSRTTKRSRKSIVLTDEIVRLLAARVEHRWEAPSWAADQFFKQNAIAVVRQSVSPGGVACAFADLPYLRTFGADLLRSFRDTHRESPIGLHLHVYRTTEIDVAQFLEDNAMTQAPWLGLSFDSEAAAIYAERRSLVAYYVTARFILIDRLLEIYRRPLAMIDADVEIRRDLASFFATMRSVDIGLIMRDEDKLAWRRLLAAAVFVNDTAGAQRFVRYLAECVADDIWGDLPFSLDALYLHFCHRAAVARSDLRFGRIPMGMSDHGFAAESWIWHRKGDRKRVARPARLAAAG